MATKKLKLTDITIDGGTQIREKLDLATVDEYAEAYESGAEFPPLKVCYDGKAYWIYDGFHRWHARKKAEASHAEVEVYQGTLRDAKQLAAGANADHGLKRTNADKRAAVLVFLEDDEWAQWSDNKIAEAAGVSDPFVSKVRSELLTVSSSAVSKAADKPRVGRDGKSRKPPKRTAVSDFFDGKNAESGNGQSKAAPQATAALDAIAEPLRERFSKLKPSDQQVEAFGEYTCESQELLLESVEQKLQTLTQAIETGEVPEPTIDDVIKGRNKAIESFCRSLTKWFDENVPQDEWLSHQDLIESARSKIKSCCSTLRTAKCHSACPVCDGNGCAKCLSTGRVTKHQYDMLAK